MFEITEDPTCIIIYKGEQIIMYYAWENNELWIILGTCRKTGECIVGAVNPKLDGMPRLDVPVRPEIECKCGLFGIYVNDTIST